MPKPRPQRKPTVLLPKRGLFSTGRGPSRENLALDRTVTARELASWLAPRLHGSLCQGIFFWPLPTAKIPHHSKGNTPYTNYNGTSMGFLWRCEKAGLSRELKDCSAHTNAQHADASDSIRASFTSSLPRSCTIKAPFGL